ASIYFNFNTNPLEKVDFEKLNFEILDFTAFPLLKILRVSDFPSLISMTLTSNLNLKSLDVSKVPQLPSLIIPSSILETLRVDNLPQLTSLYCNDKQLNSLTVSNLPNLGSLFCFNNKLSSLSFLNVPNLEVLHCYNNLMSSLDVNNLNNLQVLICSKNKLPLLDVSSLINCKIIDCSENLLSLLNVNGLVNLKSLKCDHNQISSLNVINLSNLSFLLCSYNQLSSLNFSGLRNLSSLVCSHNQLTSIDMNALTSIRYFSCGYNQLASLDMSNASNLVFFECSGNQLTNLDLSNSVLLDELYCSGLPLLKTILFKNGSNESIIDISDNLSLIYICADDSQLTQVQNLIIQNGYSNCNLNSYCSFTPGGIFYTIQGNNNFDINNNGCDLIDPIFPNLKLNLANGRNTGSFITNNTGSFSIPLQAGTHTISPVLENPTYFTVSPATTTVTFPTQASPFTQNFCVTPKGTHSDVEISVVPIDRARPGFDAKYKIVYKNKGNQVENGGVNLSFDDAKMDYVLSSSVFNGQARNQLTWNYTNLQPFETRSIDVVFNINSPMETPAVNGGDVLNYTATISTAHTDELPSDNSFTLNQTVVNSFDPNDITCLEGATVSSAKVGDYVHYMIRFENTGSANATNIVVKDVVNSAKYDVNSIVPINGSHDFYTRINGDNVEFIFENINLPFTDATNDGYVSFKIKTKASLVTGDTFSKNANIYFDYNFPITTNTVTTTIAALANQDFEFGTYFNLFPNPASSYLNIETKADIELYSVQVYNALGQLVLVQPQTQNTKTIDVSSLTTGNYFIKINSNKGTSNTKFIKQ
ncbi:hypothetical protein BWK59_12510, partial [Flavobacterium davisii]